MEAAEPAVDRHRPVTTVVAFEVAVMQVVEVVGVADRLARLAELQLVESGVARRRRQSRVHQVHHGVQRMRRDDPMQEHAGEVDQVLDRVHRQPRPGADVDVLVVQVVSRLVERLPVGEPVRPVEVHLAQQADGHEQQDEVDRVGAEIDVRQVAVGVHPHREGLEQRPHADAADQGPEHVVARLIAEQEPAVAGAEPAPIVLVVRALRPLDEQAKVPGAEPQEDDPCVAQVDADHPARLETRHALQLRGQEQPGHHAHRDEDRVERIQVARESEQPLQKRLRPRRPHEHRRRLYHLRGLPLTACIARSKVRFRHCRHPPGWRATAVLSGTAGQPRSLLAQNGFRCKHTGTAWLPAAAWPPTGRCRPPG